MNRRPASVVIAVLTGLLLALTGSAVALETGSSVAANGCCKL